MVERHSGMGMTPEEAVDYLVRMARTPIQNCSLADLEEAEAVLRRALQGVKGWAVKVDKHLWYVWTDDPRRGSKPVTIIEREA